MEENIVWYDYSLKTTKESAADVLASLDSEIQKVPDDGLFIFLFGGHGGRTTKNRPDMAPKGKTNYAEYLCLGNGVDHSAYGKVFDYELWDEFKKCRGRVFAVFDCCKAGTMYKDMHESDKYGTSSPELVDLPGGEQIDVYDDDYSMLHASVNATLDKMWLPNVPVYAKIKKDDGVRICAFSASPEQGSEQGNKTTGGKFMQYLTDKWNSTYRRRKTTYQQLFHDSYIGHRQIVTETTGRSICSFSDGFRPYEYSMFR